MPAAETARLIASLELKDKMSAGIKTASRSVDRFDDKWSKVSGKVKKGLIIGGAATAGFIAANVRLGVQSLADLESAVTSVDGAIQQMGLTGQITGKQIADEANRIEAAIGAAFDDKDITRATATLIRFGKVTPPNLKQAMEVMTDLAARTGSVDSAANLLGKALADPERAAGKLARQGIVLTKSEQAQIKAFIKAGDKAKAQKVILDELAKTTKGAAAATQGPYKRALSELSDVAEDAQRALGEGFLPVIERVADLLKTNLAKPEVMANIREFGQGLAKGLDSVIDLAQRIPWGTIGDSLRIAGAGAKAVLDAFLGLPPWIQTAVLTGWGLNKLSGGILGDVVGELGKGLIKGVLGMNAGVVNIKAGVVNGAGGVGGGVGGGTGRLGKALAGASVVADIAGVIATQQQVSGQNTAIAKGLSAKLDQFLATKPTPEALKRALAGVEKGIRDIESNPLHTLVQGEALTQLKGMRSKLAAVVGENAHPGKTEDDHVVKQVLGSNQKGQIVDKTTAKTKDIQALKDTTTSWLTRNHQAAGKIADDVVAARDAQVGATRSAESGIKGATYQSGAMVATAVRQSRPIVNTKTDIRINVTASGITKTVSTSTRYGPSNGSAGGNAWPGGEKI